jgi:hypothetical protein
MADFDPGQFVNRIGRRLVTEFADAAEAGTPGLIGAAREHPARLQLVKLLPALVSVGSGLLIDSHGGQSKQQDIVLFERDLCPIYSINDAPEATYYPIESVVAVGEVKSTVSKVVLFDALDKIRSSKALKRFSKKENLGIGQYCSYRKYGSHVSFAGTAGDEYDQTNKYTDQIFTFIMCNTFAQSKEAILENLVEYQREFGHELMPNIIISLNDGFIQGMTSNDFILQKSLMQSDSFSFIPANDRAFSYLVNELRQHIIAGRSVPIEALDRYLDIISGALPPCTARRFELRQ